MTEQMKNICYWLGSSVIVLFIIAWFFVAEVGKVTRTLQGQYADDFCPSPETGKVWGIYEIPPPKILGSTAIIIDTSDALPSEVRLALREHFAGFNINAADGVSAEEIDIFKEVAFIKPLRNYERVRVYGMTERIGDFVVSSFDMCVPRHKGINALTENERKLWIKFIEKFRPVLSGVIENLAVRPEAKWSPIMETVHSTAAKHDRIVLVSDLMHHTPSCSLYKAQGNFANRDYSNCAEGAESLDDTSIEVLFVKREKLRHHQTKGLIDLWRSHIENNGGKFDIRGFVSIGDGKGKFGELEGGGFR